MRAVGITKLAAGLHVGLAAAAIYYATRLNNDVSLSEITGKELSVMCGIVLLPILYAWIGLRLARTESGLGLLAIGQVVALLVFATTFVAVLRSHEPMAPLLFVLASLWLAVGFLAVLCVVRLLGRLVR